MRRFLGMGSMLAATLAAAAAHAEAPPVRLEYVRAAGAEHCAEQGAIEAAVRARLGYDPFRETAARTLVASIRREGKDRLRGDVTLRDARGTRGARQLSSNHNDCGELVAAMTLAMTIAIDPQAQPAPDPVPGTAAAAGAPPGADAPTPPVPPPGEPWPSPVAPPSAAKPSAARPNAAKPKRPDPAANAAAQNLRPGDEARDPGAARGRSATTDAAPAEPEDPSRARLGGVLGLSAVASLGTAPGVAIGVVAQAGLTYGIASANVEGRADLPSSAEADRGTVRARLYAGSLVPCIHPRPFVFGCVVGTLGALHGEGEGVPDPRTETSLFGALGGRVGARLPLVGALAARATADIGAVLTPTTLELSGAEVWASPPVYGALGIGAEVRLP